MQYAFDDVEPDLNGLEKAVFLAWKASIDMSEARREKSVEDGKKGGRPPKKKTGVSETERGVFENKPGFEIENLTETGTETETETEKKEPGKKESAQRFRKPSVDEVREYCQQRGNGIEAQTFVDFYEGVGWKVGTKPMKDWKACVRTWEQRRKERARSGTTNKFSAGIVQSDYSDFNEEDWIAN